MRQYQHTGRIIKRNHSNALPRYIVAVDTETNRNEDRRFGEAYAHTFRLGCMQFGRYAEDELRAVQSSRFLHPDAFWNTLRTITGPRHTTWIVGHNVLFDLITLGITERFERSSIVLDAPRKVRQKTETADDKNGVDGLAVLENPPFILGLRIPETSGRIVVVDTMNWFRCSLEEIGKQIGIEKVPLPSFDANDEHWFHRCEIDVDITMKCFVGLMKWVKENDMGMFRYTASAQAMAAYRHRFLQAPIYYHDNKQVKEHERRSFIGGRVECFKVGRIDEQVFCVDVNSLYPFIMREYAYPSKLEWSESPDEYRPVPNGLDMSNCVAECRVECYTQRYPLKSKHGVIYPIGQFDTYLCGSELSAAQRNGDIRGIRFLAKYQCDELFTNWVDTLWQLRQEYKQSGNAMYAMFAKHMLNSLFGKFAQRGSEWEPMGITMDSLPWSQWFGPSGTSGETAEYRSIGWNVFRKVKRPELSTTMIAISAFVSANARRYMDRIRGTALTGNVYYQGVDGLIVNDSGWNNLKSAGMISDTELGKLRLTMTTNQCHIYNGNDYQVGNRAVVAGRSSIVESPESKVIKHRMFSGLAGLFDRRTDGAVIESIREWNRREQYKKGTVLSDGTVAPIEIWT